MNLARARIKVIVREMKTENGERSCELALTLTRMPSRSDREREKICIKSAFKIENCIGNCCHKILDLSRDSHCDAYRAFMITFTIAHRLEGKIIIKLKVVFPR